MTHHATVCRLPERGLISVSGAEAVSFLQNLVTQDINLLSSNALVYSCLLTPQGRFLHDFFISGDGSGGFFLECGQPRREDLIRRLGIFKLRAKVVIAACEEFDVYAATAPPAGTNVFSDPRLSALGYRFYRSRSEPRIDAAPSTEYSDRRICLGVPEGSPDIKPEIDILSDVNLDRLNAVSWDKGCYVGQEVTARMHYRALVKKRMVVLSGNALVFGDSLVQNGHAVGEVRSVNASGTQALAVLKLAALAEGAIITAAGVTVAAALPGWL